MKKEYTVLLCLLIISFLLSCEKTDPGDCFKSTGKIIMENRPAADISYISLENNVNLILTQDSTPEIIVEAGENLLKDIKTELQNNLLYIRNENRCNWVRSYDKEINVYVSVQSLDSIDYQGSGDIYCTNTIMSDSIILDVRAGSGSINLDIEVISSYLSLHTGTADVNMSGYSGVCFIYANDYGPFNCRKLITDYMYINNRGTNDCYITVKKELGATIEYMGNIYYYGNPPVVFSKILGSGELIKME